MRRAHFIRVANFMIPQGVFQKSRRDLFHCVFLGKRINGVDDLAFSSQKTVGMVVASRLHPHADATAMTAVVVLKDRTVFLVGNDGVGIARNHDDGDVVPEKHVHLINGVIAIGEDGACVVSCHAGKFGVDEVVCDAHAAGAGEKV